MSQTTTRDSVKFTQPKGLRGMHNAQNSMAVVLAAKSIGVKDEVIRESFQSFKNAPHRLENVGKVAGVQYINDSKATNINSVWYALESQNSEVILILGGIDKGNDYNIILSLVKEKVKAIICLGENNDTIENFFRSHVNNIYSTSSMMDAVEKSFKYATKGDTVLLSPACASFDLFASYEERGDMFRKCVMNI